MHACAVITCILVRACYTEHVSSRRKHIFTGAVCVLLSWPAFAGQYERPREAIYDPGGRALGKFHAALRRTARGISATRILQFGASHTEADRFTGYLREVLQAKFGDAGHGYLMPARPWKGYRHMDVRHDSSAGWLTDKAWSRTGKTDGLYGLAGFSCSSESADDWARVGTTQKSNFGRSVSRIELFWLEQPGGGRFDLMVDNTLLSTISTHGDTVRLGARLIRVPDGPHTVEIRPRGDGEVRLFGVTLERDAPGVVVDSLGIRGARASVILKWNAEIWAQQLTRRRPDLVLLAYGTNEAGDTHQPIERYERILTKVIARVKGASPQASCVLVGPTDRPMKRGRRWVSRPRVTDVIRTQRTVASRFGCGFWDARDSMGGELSIVRWRAADPPLASKDHVHLTTRGYYALADDLQKALLYGWRYRR